MRNGTLGDRRRQHFRRGWGSFGCRLRGFWPLDCCYPGAPGCPLTRADELAASCVHSLRVPT